MKFKFKRPLAIAMWDFSWLERRWPGAGYEDWDQALSELKARGYDAVRIDAYPHLVAKDPKKLWTLRPEWSVQDWGSPALNRVQVQPHLNQFLRKCRQHGILVALSTWFRQDADDLRMRIKTPAQMGQIWKRTLDSIADAGLLNGLLYVDLCNEFPVYPWTPFLYPKGPGSPELARREKKMQDWTRGSIDVVRRAYPQLDYCYSFCTQFDHVAEEAVDHYDLLEVHQWMANTGKAEFYKEVGYNYERFSGEGYENVVLNAERVYRRRPQHWKKQLATGIQGLAEWSRRSGLPLVTTECWGIVDYKDWPLLSWDWVKELCAFGSLEASRSGRWAAIATSNFCGPQFKGMWRDVAWHKRLTKAIHQGPLNFPQA